MLLSSTSCKGGRWLGAADHRLVDGVGYIDSGVTDLLLGLLGAESPGRRRLPIPLFCLSHVVLVTEKLVRNACSPETTRAGYLCTASGNGAEARALPSIYTHEMWRKQPSGSGSGHVVSVLRTRLLAPTQLCFGIQILPISGRSPIQVKYFGSLLLFL